MPEPRNPNQRKDYESWRDDDPGRGRSDEEIGGRVEEADEFEDTEELDEEDLEEGER